MHSGVQTHQAGVRLQQFLALTKPRVVSLIVFTAMIGMFLATPGMVPLNPLLFGTLGIALVAGAAAAINCLVEYKIDAVMARSSATKLVGVARMTFWPKAYSNRSWSMSSAALRN